MSCLLDPVEEGGDGDLWWSAEWGLAGDSVGHAIESDPDLAGVVAGVVDDIRSSGFTVARIDWIPGHGDVDVLGEVDRRGVVLPDRL